MKFLLFLIAVSAWAAPARLIYTKSFPGSVPPFVYVGIDRTGALQYKESATDDQPVSAQLGESETAQLFALADKLNHFQDPLESGLKVANTGKKTFRYEDENGKGTQSVFNYSISLDVRQLLDRLENIAQSERAYLDLDRTVHFDKLGVNDALAQIESLWLRKELAAPGQFIPLLTRISTHESFMHLARDRAARLKDQFQTPPSVAQVQPQ